MNHQALGEVCKRLSAPSEVAETIAAYEETSRYVGALAMDDEPKAALASAVSGALAALRELADALKSGDYIVVDPDLSGWRYQTCHFLPDTGLKEYVRGHENLASVAALALQLGQPVVVGSEHPQGWREQTATRLRKAGVVAITDMEGRD